MGSRGRASDMSSRRMAGEERKQGEELTLDCAECQGGANPPTWQVGEGTWSFGGKLELEILTGWSSAKQGASPARTLPAESSVESMGALGGLGELVPKKRRGQSAREE